MKITFWILGLLVGLAGTGYAEPTPLTLDQAVDLALRQGADNRIIEMSLATARAVHAQNVARNSLSLSANAAYGAGEAFGNATLAGRISPGSVPSAVSSSRASGENAAPTIPQSLQAGLNLATPLTKLGLTATHAFQLNTDQSLSQASQVGLSLNQTLWDGYPGGAALASVDKSALGLQGSQITAEAARLSLVYKVKQAFYTLLSAQENLSLLQKTLEQRQSFLTILQAKYAVKQASTIDLKDAQINAKTAEIDGINGQNTLRTARARLALLLGWEMNTAFTVVAQSDPTSPVDSLEQALQLGLSRRTELKQLTLNQQAAAIDLALLQGQTLPQVSLTSGVNVIQDWTAQKLAESVTVGVKVSLPIIDSGLVQQQINQNGLTNTSYALQRNQLIGSISADIQDAFYQYQVKLARLEVAQLTAEKLDLQNTIAQTKYEAGTVTNSDVMTAEVNWTTAIYARANAKIAAQLAALQLQYVLGL